MRDSVQKYFEKSGDTEIAHGRITTRGDDFCIWNETPDSIVLIQVYGDGALWDAWAIDMAKKLGKKKITFATQRNPKGFVRKFGYEVTGYILEKEV